MRIAVTGSIATDHLMVFPGSITDQLVPERLERVSLSFLVDDLHIHRGGVAANIAFGLAQLGLTPVLVGAVGADFGDYRAWLESHGVDTASVHVSATRHTARFLCTTDEAQNQIASFYAGAMSEARDIDLARVAAHHGGLDLVVIAPNDPDAMLRHTRDCRAHGYRFAADPSQQLARLTGPQARTLVEGAELLFTNEYEHDLLLSVTGWTRDAVLSRVGRWITTLGENGVRIESRTEPALTIPAVPTGVVVDPTGVGDAFRAGFLAGLSRRTGIEQAARMGATLASLVLESAGGQEYVFTPGEFLSRLHVTYGPAAATDIEHRVLVGDAGL
ncbi:carbohydrate kinase family protein [Amycolatopsis rifamycinica]|uniref:Ribokinase n=1 Tax=Amycolatopsis rifamycinica TaxID=287986 RepID=A0A066U9P8_9PSEU|nr:carbohydrate kinase family protein [Amycolatopsis rifamycinica]KDN22577.1 ribokinase [Amycolatopsis rifamycinica]